MDPGQQRAALATIEEASSSYGEPAQTDLDTHRSDLAMSLNNQSNFLADLSRQEAALNAIEEAVSIYRELAETYPDAFRPGLAMTLNNKSNRLRNLGHPQAALERGRGSGQDPPWASPSPPRDIPA